MISMRANLLRLDFYADANNQEKELTSTRFGIGLRVCGTDVAYDNMRCLVLT